jgi:hypothetical protein
LRAAVAKARAEAFIDTLVDGQGVVATTHMSASVA